MSMNPQQDHWMSMRDKASKSKPAMHEDSTDPEAKDGHEHADDIHSVVSEHGKAKKIEHEMADDHVMTHSTHEDGHKHSEKHASLEEAQEHAKHASASGSDCANCEQGY
jgi:hypothetical protein